MINISFIVMGYFFKAWIFCFWASSLLNNLVKHCKYGEWMWLGILLMRHQQIWGNKGYVLKIILRYTGSLKKVLLIKLLISHTGTLCAFQNNFKMYPLLTNILHNDDSPCLKKICNYLNTNYNFLDVLCNQKYKVSKC